MSDKPGKTGRGGDETPRSVEAMTRIRRAFGAPPPPPADFVDRVMRSVAVAPAPRRGFLSWLWRPVEVRFSFRPGMALACAMVLAVGAVGAARFLTLRERGAPAYAGLIAPSVEPTQPGERAITVRFALHAPAAREVALAGDWNGWKPETLRRGPDGTWTLTRPLPGGDWRYSFVVDGAWVDDPLAEAHRPDGFGGTNAVLRL